MSSLQQSIERRHAADGHAPNPCYATEDGVTALRVETSRGEVWILPWHHFVFAKHEAADHELLVMTFVAHEVELRGVNLTELVQGIASQRIEWLRTAPEKYLKSAGDDPAILDIQVRPLAEPAVSE